MVWDMEVGAAVQRKRVGLSVRETDERAEGLDMQVFADSGCVRAIPSLATIRLPSTGMF